MIPSSNKSRFLPQKLLAGALLALFLFAQGTQPAHAQWVTVADVPRILEWVTTFVWTVSETMGYKILKNTLNRFGQSLAQNAFGEFAKGSPGEEPMFETRPLEQILFEEAGKGNDYIIEGVAAGLRTANNDFSARLKTDKEGKEALEVNLKSQQDELVARRDALEASGDLADCNNQPAGSACPARDELKEIDSAIGRTTKDLGNTMNEKNRLTENLKQVGTFESQEKTYKNTREANERGGYEPMTAAIINTLCNPSLSFQLSIAFPLATMPLLDKPVCKWADFTSNWDKAIKSTGVNDLFNGQANGWQVLNSMIKPDGSGPAVTLALGFNAIGQRTEHLQKEQTEAMIDKIVGAKGAGNLVGTVLTPGPLVSNYMQTVIEKSAEKDTNPALTGKLAADLASLADTFLNSLIGASERLIFKGIANRARPAQQQSFNLARGAGGAGNPGQRINLQLSEGAPDLTGAAAAQLIKVLFDGVSYGKEAATPINNILAKLQNADNCEIDPDFCVIGSQFASAIEQKLTLREAMSPSKGLLTGRERFGFNVLGQSIQKEFQTAFPYESLVVLRKYRVIPVGWEIAALYIKGHPPKINPTVCNGTDCTLKDVVDGFSVKESPFYRLVDQDWVLKIPPLQCAASGWGPPIITGEEAPSCPYDDNEDGGKGCVPNEMSYRTKTYCRTLLGVNDFCKDAKDSADNFDVRLCIPTDEEARRCQDKADLSGDPKPFKGKVLDTQVYASSRSKICLAPESCLSEDDTGKCAVPKGGISYGYCVEERAKLVIRGSKCEKEYATCLGYTDELGKTSYYLENSIPDSPNARARLEAVWAVTDSRRHPPLCDKTSAGCRWLSLRQVPTSTSPSAPPSFNPDNSFWSSSTPDRVYLTPSAPACPSEQAGCTELSGGTRAAYLVAPPEYGCDTSDGYKKKQCQPYALSCGTATNNYVGCRAFTPVTYPDPAIAGQNPVGCDDRCIGLTSWIEKQTGIEELYGELASAAFLNFTPASAQSCSREDAGCEEFTDIQKEQNPGSGEARIAFSKLMQCTTDAAQPEDTFYSWFGSDSQGSRLVKYIYKSEPVAGTPAPKCADNTHCRCASDAADGSSVGDSDVRKGVCRQFINVNGALSYRWTDLLILADATDCKNYRRTRGTQAAIAFSPSKSRSCPRSAIGCHEYHAPFSANRQVILSETFDAKDINIDWVTGVPPSNTTTTFARISNDTETLNQKSLRVDGGGYQVWRLLPGSFSQTASTTIEFAIKTDASTTVSAGFRDDTSDTMTTATTEAGGVQALRWTTLTFYGNPASADRQWLWIKTNVPFTLDRVLVKQANGISAFVRQSDGSIGSVTEAQCSNSDESVKARFGSVQYSCQMYKDASGAQAAFQGFDRLCPMQLVNCKEFSDTDQKSFARVIDDHFDSDSNAGLAGWASNSALSVNGALSVAGNNPVAKDLPVPIKKDTPYTLTFRYRDTGAMPVGGVETVEAQLVLSGRELHFSDASKGYTEKTTRFAQWQKFTFSAPSFSISGDQENAALKIIPSGNPTSYAIDDVVLTDDSGRHMRYLVDEFSKSCNENYTGCTAYGLPNFNASSSLTSWSTLTYLLPRSKATVENSTLGVCREDKTSCKAYTIDGNKNKPVWFKDPLGRVCEYRSSKTLSFCKNDVERGTFTSSCFVVSDCVIKNADGVVIEDKGTCDPYAGWVRKSCKKSPDRPCMKDSDCADTTTVVDDQKCVDSACPAPIPSLVSATDLGDGTTGTDNPNAEFWVRQCTQNDNTCRKITDPECGDNTPSNRACTSDADCTSQAYSRRCLPSGYCALKNVDSLRSNYGRGEFTGVACQREYYFKDDVSKSECAGVNVDGGCLLFMDESEGVGAKYDSQAYYSAYHQNYRNGGPTAAVSLTESPNSLTVVGGTVSQNNAARDANQVLQVRFDRECKTQLVCSKYLVKKNEDDGKEEHICQERRPCDVEAGTNTCASNQYRPPARNANWSLYNRALKGLFKQDDIKAGTDLSYMMLTGFARPGFDFGGGESEATQAGGRDSYFDWQQPLTPGGTQTLMINNPAVIVPAPWKDGIDDIPRDASCKAIPKADTPSEREVYGQSRESFAKASSVSPSLDYECSYRSNITQYGGLSGYCLDSVNRQVGTTAPIKTASMCVQWYPVDATHKEAARAAGFATPSDAYWSNSGSKIYYCLRSELYGPEISSAVGNGAASPSNFATRYVPSVCPSIPSSAFNQAACTVKNEEKNVVVRRIPFKVWGCGLTDKVAFQWTNNSPPIGVISNPTVPDLTSGRACTLPYKDAVSQNPDVLFLYRPLTWFQEEKGAITDGDVSSLVPPGRTHAPMPAGFSDVDSRGDGAFASSTIKSIDYSFITDAGLANCTTPDTAGCGLISDKNSKLPYGLVFKGKGGKNVSDIETSGLTTLGCDEGDYYFAIQPAFDETTELITRWKWRFCDKYKGELPFETTSVVAVRIKLNLEQVSPVIRKAQASGEYCKSYILLADEKIAVPGSQPLARSLIVDEQKLSERNRIRRETADLFYRFKDAVNGPDVDHATNPAQKHACFNADPVPSLPAETQSCTKNIEVAQSDGSCGRSDDLSQAICYASRYYLRPLEVWQWDVSGTYKKTASLNSSTGICSGSDCDALTAPWTAAKENAVSPVLTFSIHPSSGQQTGTANQTLYSNDPFEIQVDINVDPKVTPALLRSLMIDWGDGTPQAPILTFMGENDSTLYKTTKGTANTPVTFTAVNSYRNRPDGKTICIKAINSLLASTKQCAVLTYRENGTLITPSPQDPIPDRDDTEPKPNP